MASSSDTTELLLRLKRGDTGALDALLPRVHDELRRIAHRERVRRAGGETLQTTALVNEAYLKLVDQTRLDVADRAHFLALAALSIRHIVIDDARRRGSQKRGGGWARVSLDRAPPIDEDPIDLLALDAALRRLEQLDSTLSRVVECRFFADMTVEETALALGIGPRTVDRAWAKARAWLYQEIHETE